MSEHSLLVVALEAAAVLAACCLPALAAKPLPMPAEQSLDGSWEILFDPDNRGREGAWHRDKVFASQPGRREIRVPSCWEEIEKDYEGVAYYRRRFTAPAEWEGKVVRLRFGAVNFRAEVWLNDQAVGTHEGGFSPFEFHVGEILRPGKTNTLTLRVAGPILLQDKRIEGVGPMETPQWRGAITGGIWQPVRLVATGTVVVENVFVQPRLADDTATVCLDLQHRGTKTRKVDLEIAIRVKGPGGPTVAKARHSLELPPGLTQRRETLTIPSAVYWSPDNPHLYQGEVAVRCGGAVSDRVCTPFGMREFTVRDKQFVLNGKPLYLKATFFEGLYPVKLAYPDSRAMARREIRLAKAAGFNMIRPWRKPPPPMWLDLADEMGVLTVGSLAIECMDYPVETARLPGWVANEVHQSILRDRNRACVVQWELFNELKRPVLKRLLHPMAMLARQLDPTRMILDESGGWARGANLYLPHSREPMKFNDIHDYPGPQVNQEVYTKLLLTGRKTHQEMRAMGLKGRLPGRNVVPGLMTYFSELGYGSLPDLVESNRRFEKVGNPIVPPAVYHKRLATQHGKVLKDSGFDRVYPDLKQYCLAQQKIHGLANRRMIEAVRCNPQVKGYCIHALTAGDWVLGAGLLDLFRNPKTLAYEQTKAANQPRILAVRVHPRNVYAPKGTKLEITGVNDLQAAEGTLKVSVVASDKSVVFRMEEQATLAAGIARLFGRKLATTALRGPHAVHAQFTPADGSPTAEGNFTFDVFGAEQLAAPKARIAVLDPTRRLTRFLKEVAVPCEDFTSDTDRSLPVFVSRTAATTPRQKQQFEDLKRFVAAGGTAVYLGGIAPNLSRWNVKAPRVQPPLLPIGARPRVAIGLWTCIPHIVRDHPIFDGLPTNCMMGPVYENVWAEQTLREVGGEAVVGAIGYDWFPEMDLRKRHYYGPGDTWWGADLAIVPHKRGRCIISQLRLVENLAADPVADKILLNLIRYTGARPKPER